MCILNTQFRIYPPNTNLPPPPPFIFAVIIITLKTFTRFWNKDVRICPFSHKALVLAVQFNQLNSNQFNQSIQSEVFHGFNCLPCVQENCLLVPVTGICNATTYKAKLDNCVWKRTTYRHDG